MRSKKRHRGIKVIKVPSVKNWPKTRRIKGSVYHRTGKLGTNIATGVLVAEYDNGSDIKWMSFKGRIFNDYEGQE